MGGRALFSRDLLGFLCMWINVFYASESKGLPIKIAHAGTSVQIYQTRISALMIRGGGSDVNDAGCE